MSSRLGRKAFLDGVADSCLYNDSVFRRRRRAGSRSEGAEPVPFVGADTRGDGNIVKIKAERLPMPIQ